MTAKNILEQHARVLFQFDETNRITRINESDPETDAPLVFLAFGAGEVLCLYRHDVDEKFVEHFGSEVSKLPTWSKGQLGSGVFDSLRAVVQQFYGKLEESHGPAFAFPDSARIPLGQDESVIAEDNAHLLDDTFPYTKSVLSERSPVLALIRDGRAVSACYVARKFGDAVEAGVATLEGFQGQGLAKRAVALWAQTAVDAGLTPLYSTSWSNAASLRIAKSLGLIQYADTLAFSVPLDANEN